MHFLAPDILCYAFLKSSLSILCMEIVNFGLHCTFPLLRLDDTLVVSVPWFIKGGRFTQYRKKNPATKP